MLPSPSGNNPLHQTYVFNIEDQSQIGEARRFTSILCDRLNFDEVNLGRISIIINELATNLLKYSGKGQLLVRIIDRRDGAGVEIISVDKGPGISDTAEALKDGFSTGTSPGTGLGSVKRQAHVFDIYSVQGSGTIVYSAVYTKEKPNQSEYNIGAVCVPMEGEILCGDAWCVSEVKGQLQILMVDGLGHGPRAHAAATDAIDEFKKSSTLPLADVFNAIHNRLRGTRGGALQLCRWDGESKLDYASAGNIRGLIQTDKLKNLVSQNGTAGVRVSGLKIFTQEWAGDGFLILHSDGITSRADLSKYPGILSHHPAIAATVMYRDFNRGTDDSTVLVVAGRR